MISPQVPLTHIHNSEDLAIGIEHLQHIDPTLWAIANAIEDIPLRLRQPGFEGLADIITAQLISRASATAIFNRLTSLINPLNANSFLQAGEAPLIEAGLSRAKQKTLKGLADAIESNMLDLETLCTLPAKDAHRSLTNLKGIGPWTAEVFLLFCAGHADIFPVGDIALQRAAADVLRLKEKPDTKEMANISSRWSPVRGVAARVLYAHYALIKGRKALPV